MLITRFYKPEDESSDKGLHEINMTRLGRFIVIAGKNGSGKTRLLNTLIDSIQFKKLNISRIQQHLDHIEMLEVKLASNPPDHDRQRESFEQHIKESKKIVSQLTDCIHCESIDEIKEVKFVPKNLNFSDPSDSPKSHLAALHTQANHIGLESYSSYCLGYIQHLQDLYWEATHQDFQGNAIEKKKVVERYGRLNDLITALLDTHLSRIAGGVAAIFDKPLAKAALSDGQKVILQFTVAIHAQGANLGNSVFIMDEPETHLHPSILVEIIKKFLKHLQRRNFG